MVHISDKKKQELKTILEVASSIVIGYHYQCH